MSERVIERVRLPTPTEGRQCLKAEPTFYSPKCRQLEDFCTVSSFFPMHLCFWKCWVLEVKARKGELTGSATSRPAWSAWTDSSRPLPPAPRRAGSSLGQAHGHGDILTLVAGGSSAWVHFGGPPGRQTGGTEANSCQSNKTWTRLALGIDVCIAFPVAHGSHLERSLCGNRRARSRVAPLRLRRAYDSSRDGSLISWMLSSSCFSNPSPGPNVSMGVGTTLPSRPESRPDVPQRIKRRDDITGD